MKYFLVFILSAFALCSSTKSYAQQVKTLSKPFTIVCYGTPNGSGVNLRTPLGAINARTASSNFEVTYHDFSPEAQAAFQRAVDIWSSLISSPVTIKIDAYWSELGAGVLGSATWIDAKANFEGALVPNVYYPIALAEKMAGKNLNESSEYDILANFNKDANWYLATDGQPGNGQYDLVSVVLHEIGHGLGFIDSFYYDSGSETAGKTYTIPFVFDSYVANAQNKFLLKTYTDGSTALAEQLTNNGVYFKSEFAPTKSGNIRLYAPTAWSDGSSIAHLNENTYNTTVNALMTPQIGAKEVLHNPGPVTLNMFDDLGWKYTYINHESIANNENYLANNYEVSASISSDTSYNKNSVNLYYSYNGFQTDSTRVTIAESSTADLYKANIPSLKKEGQQYSYFLQVTDADGRTFRKPSLESRYYTFKTETDTQAPQITTLDKGHIKESDTTVLIQAFITDFLAIEELEFSYYLNNETPTTSLLEQDPEIDSLYTASIDIKTLNIKDGDIFTYRISATDNASTPHTKVLEQTLPVEEYNSPAKSFEADFSTGAENFFTSSSFNISSYSGFSTPALHSPHPYANAFPFLAEGQDFMAELKTPIILEEEKSAISYDEVVLVEPGESDTDYTSTSFYDYVILEASNDDGQNWYPLINGYDSRSKDEWLIAYASNYNSTTGNSATAGETQLLLNRKFDLLKAKNFIVGDTIKIRFRLHTDESAYGWGWAIDNLKIQIETITSTNDDLSADDIITYPNPAINTIKFKFPEAYFGQTEMQILNSAGNQIGTYSFTISENSLPEINCSHWASGIYFIRFIMNEEIIVKKILIQK